MRRESLLVALLVLATVPAAPPTAAAPAGLLEDAAGDTRLVTAPGAEPAPFSMAGQTESVDLLALRVEETDDAVAFVVQVAKLEGNPGGEVAVAFSWNGAEHRAVASRSASAFGEFAFAWLEVEDDDDWERVAPLEMAVDVAAGTIAVTVPKPYLLDARDRTPQEGDALRGIRVEAQQSTMRLRLMDARPGGVVDAMPDSGEGASFTLARGDAASGHVRLSTPERTRVSNGGATTFVFQVVLSSNATFEDEFQLAFADLPDGWNGSVQSPVKVGAGQEKTLAVLMTVPFAHKHGGYDSFNVTAQSQKDPASRATVRLGVLHTPIPQPAGHHPELYLHTRSAGAGLFRTLFPFDLGFVNTDAAHDADAAEVEPSGWGGEQAWWLPLNPSLRMGLDFDVDGTGRLAGKVVGHQDVAASLDARILLVREDEGDREEMVLAEGGPADLALKMGEATPFELTLVPTPESDYVPHRPDQNLVVEVTLRPDDDAVCCVTLGGIHGPRLTTADFLLKLPLEEYHDRLPEAAVAANALELVADGPVEKAGRPGSVVTYQFDLRNGGPEAVIDVDVAGADAIYGLVVPAANFILKTGETKRVTLAVHLPGDATEGRQFELLAFAHAQEDPSQMAIARTLTTATFGSEAVDDETDVLLAARDAERPTPGAPAALVALAALAAALAVGRRR